MSQDTSTSHHSHHLFLLLVSVIAVGIIAFGTFQLIDLFQETPSTADEDTLQTEGVTITNAPEPLPDVEDTSVAPSGPIRGTIISLFDNGFRMILDGQPDYPELEVIFTSTTVVESLLTSELDNDGSPQSSPISGSALVTGDTVDVIATANSGTDSNAVAADRILLYR